MNIIFMEQSIVSPEETQQDNEIISVRPKFLDDFTGQAQAKENLKVFIKAARQREESLDHTLFHGPPGLGKTTLAHIVATEMGVGFRATSGPVLTKSGDLAAILTNLQPNDVLFIDEIHRLNANVEEVLYSAMEDFKLDIIIGEGPAARTVRIDLQPFTLIGATTRLGLVSNPLRDRFGIPVKLEFYNNEDLMKVITRASALLEMAINDEGAQEIAGRSRGTPRIAVRLLRRVRDFAQADDMDIISKEVADNALSRLNVDNIGLDSSDRRYMKYILENFNGGPVGIETIAAGLSEQRDSIEDTIEPYLLQCGFIARTPRGRVLSDRAYVHLRVDKPTTAQLENTLFDE